MELSETGLKCDNASCDWKDEAITSDIMADYINFPCPNCGENILTQGDYNNYMTVINIIKQVENMSDEEIESLTGGIKDLNEDIYRMKIDTHKGITLTVEKLENEE